MIIEWSPRALRDRADQLDHIARDNPLAAADQDEEIVRQIDVRHQQPRLGRLGRVKGTRELVISRTPFVAVYRLKGTQRVQISACCTAHSSGPEGSRRTVHGPRFA